jgi:phosphoglycolate phosphatase
VNNIPTDDPAVIRGILANSKALLLDFDGPVCGLFADGEDHQVAEHLRDVLAERGHADLPDDVAESADPFEVFRHAATLGADAAADVEAALTARETQAVPNATPTPGAHELMAAWQDSGRPLAIVSNNSVSAINAYLDLHELRPFVTRVAGRSTADPSELKPSPHLVKQAARSIVISPSNCTLVGDSTADMIAAIRAASATIAYAAEPDSVAELTSVHPDAVVTDMKTLVPGARAVPRRTK